MAKKSESSAQLKNDILARCSERKANTVEKLWKLLEKLHRNGGTKLTVGIVGRAAEEAGIISMQSIWNASGSDYRSLIMAYSTEKCRTTPPRRPKKVNVVESVNTLNDLDARVRLLAIIEENARLTQELTTLRAFYKRVKFPDRKIDPPNDSAPDSTPSGTSVSVIRTDALRRFLTTEWMDESALHEDAHGALYSSDGMPVAPPNFLIELRQLLGIV